MIFYTCVALWGNGKLFKSVALCNPLNDFRYHFTIKSVNKLGMMVLSSTSESLYYPEFNISLINVKVNMEKTFEIV